jgi:hypothetical protein
MEEMGVYDTKIVRSNLKMANTTTKDCINETNDKKKQSNPTTQLDRSQPTAD